MKGFAESTVLGRFPMSMFNYDTEEDSDDDHLYVGPIPEEYALQNIIQALINGNDIGNHV